MLRRAVLSTTFAIALAAPAMAADPLVYSPAPAGHPFYNPAPMIVADISFGGGFGTSDTKFAAGGARAVIDFGNSWNAMDQRLEDSRHIFTRDRQGNSSNRICGLFSDHFESSSKGMAGP